ncbi:MAG: RNA polymerase subunit sigma-70 [Planctomycetes bacterium]|nr:RNA polymerase subunit sigma-70 [Planctomycetota bacterium]
MASDGSVTHWIHETQQGNPAAAQALWELYFAKLVRLARQKQSGAPRRVADEEEVALSAFKSFCLAAQKGRFPNLADRDSLWRLLIQMTARKAVDYRRREGRQCRGGGQVLGESALYASDSSCNEPALAEVIGDAPTPEFVAIMTELYQRMLEVLEDPELQALAIDKMENYTNEEIAKRHDCSVRTVERRLELIRKKLQRALG